MGIYFPWAQAGSCLFLTHRLSSEVDVPPLPQNSIVRYCERLIPNPGYFTSEWDSNRVHPDFKSDSCCGWQ